MRESKILSEENQILEKENEKLQLKRIVKMKE
jgi:hypothetical protein